MAQSKVTNLCGASEEFNAMQNRFDDLISDALSSLEDEASTLAALLGDAFDLLLTDIRALMPELPDLPNVNLQSLVTSLSSLTEGTSEYATLLADIKSNFGEDLASLGFDLDALIPEALTEILGGGDGCSVIPNVIKAADKLTSAIEIARNSPFPLNLSQSEEAATIVKNAVLVAGRGVVINRVEKIIVEASTAVDVVSGTVTSTEPPKSDTGVFTVTDTTKGFGFGVNTIDVTPLADQNGKNITTGGFARRKSKAIERFKDFDVTQSGDTWTIKLSHLPIGIDTIKGNCLVTKYSTAGPPVPNIQTLLPIVSKDEGFDSERKRWSRYKGKAYYEVDGQTIKITGQGHSFFPHSDKYSTYYQKVNEGIQFQVSYDFFGNYDPNYVDVPALY